MHITVSRADPHSISYMLIFTKEFLCAFDCHRCSRDLNHIKPWVESARWPTTNYCRRDDWDFSLVPWRTWMTLNCCIQFANAAAAAVATAIAAQARSILFVHRLVHFMHGEKDTNTEFHLWLEFQITTIYDILPFVWNFISRNCQTVHRSVHRPVVYCVLLSFRSVFIVFAPRSFFQSNRSTGIAKHVLYSISDALSTFVRERNSNNRFHRFFIETKMIPIYKLHLVGQWAQQPSNQMKRRVKNDFNGFRKNFHSIKFSYSLSTQSIWNWYIDFFSRIVNAIIDYGSGASMARVNGSFRLEKIIICTEHKMNECNFPHNCPWTWWAEVGGRRRRGRSIAIRQDNTNGSSPGFRIH